MSIPVHCCHWSPLCPWCEFQWFPLIRASELRTTTTTAAVDAYVFTRLQHYDNAFLVVCSLRVMVFSALCPCVATAGPACCRQCRCVMRCDMLARVWSSLQLRSLSCALQRSLSSVGCVLPACSERNLPSPSLCRHRHRHRRRSHRCSLLASTRYVSADYSPPSSSSPSSPVQSHSSSVCPSVCMSALCSTDSRPIPPPPPPPAMPVSRSIRNDAPTHTVFSPPCYSHDRARINTHSHVGQVLLLGGYLHVDHYCYGA